MLTQKWSTFPKNRSPPFGASNKRLHYVFEGVTHRINTVYLLKLLFQCCKGSVSTSNLNASSQQDTSPLSMWTSSIFFSLTIFLPVQLLHRSLGLMRSPCPWHSMHTDWICCTMPGPIWWIRICMPVPLQFGQHSTAPFLPPRPGGRIRDGWLHIARRNKEAEITSAALETKATAFQLHSYLHICHR